MVRLVSYHKELGLCPGAVYVGGDWGVSADR